MKKKSNRVRSTPRMSINKLCEYMVSSNPLRRDTIIHDQKYPQDFIVSHYADAIRILPECIEQKFDDAFVTKRLQSLRTKSTSSTHASLCLKDSIAAINKGIMLKNDLPLEKANFVATRAVEPASFIVEKIEVSVRPEVIIKVVKGKQAGKTGAIKLVFSKTNPLDEEALAYDATILHQYMKDRYGEVNISREHCIVVDVFAHKVMKAPANFKTRIRKIEAACHEIMRAWDALSESSITSA